MDSKFFRDRAKRCRDLCSIAVLPEIREQLRVFAEEFEQIAAEIEDGNASPSAISAAFSLRRSSRREPDA